jgi:hypothetical protein
MSSSGYKACANCGALCELNALFCGQCGKQFGISKEDQPTIPPGEGQQGRVTRILDTTQPSPTVYTPEPTVPVSYHSPLSHRSPNTMKLLAVIGVLVMLLIGSLGFALGQVVKNNSQAGTSNTPSSSNQQVNTHTTPTIAPLTPTPTPSPTPIPQPTPTSDEGAFSGEDSFGVVVRSPNDIGGYKVGVCVSAGIYSCGISDHEVIFSDGSFYQDTPVKQAPFRPAYGTRHTYRIDVQGNIVTVWIDGSRIFQVTEDKYLSAGSVGLWSDRSQISVRSFRIISL